MLTSTSLSLTFWNLFPPEIKQMILCFMTIADLYHFSNSDPAVRCFCRHCEELITKLFINRIIELRPPIFRLYIRSFSPALAAFLCRLYQRRRIPACPPFRNLLLVGHRFPHRCSSCPPNKWHYHDLHVTQRLLQCASTPSRARRHTAVRILSSSTVPKLASFVTDPANAICFSNASPGITRRRLKIVQIERDILTNGFRISQPFPSSTILHASGSSSIFSISQFPIPHLVASITTYHENHPLRRRPRKSPWRHPGPETLTNLHIRQQHVVASRLCRAVSAVLPARFTTVHLHYNLGI